jgi:hypothetical protein|tara:strand:- start:20043 stop:20225 length:183 start_codon:yes stop_codon:yes gene_type:complete
MSPQHSRDTLYVGRVPVIGEEVDFMQTWTTPVLAGIAQEAKLEDAKSPRAEMFIDYLKAF